MTDTTVQMALDPAGPTRSDRMALRALQAGAVLVVLAATTDRLFELDRFYVPKELVLHLTALIAGILAVSAARRIRFTRVDAALLAFLLLSALSAALATNPWLATRALAVSVSGLAVFWVARALRRAGLARPLLHALSVAVVLGCAIALLQAYGIRSDFFSVNRAPGGTLGNRNSIAHMAAFGLPLVLLTALRAWRPLGYLIGALGVMVVVASLVLTRSRAGWLAFAVVLIVYLLAMLASRPLRRHWMTWARFTGILLLIGGGVAAAVLLPNSLRWRSENPYLESVRGVANYQEGSGQGRLIQYRRSMSMLASNPLLGVGPGNWPVEYPSHAAPADPSLSRSEPGRTSNPWPSSDWIGYFSERGVPAGLALVLAVLGILAAALRRLLTARDHDEGLLAATLVATLGAAVTAGMFDAVLLLGLPSLLVWSAVGALWSSDEHPAESRSSAMPGVLLVLLALLAGAGAIRSAGQVASMRLFAGGDHRASLERAAVFDPGSYRVRMGLARSYGAGSDARCRHALAARSLLPQAQAARTLARGCGE